MDDQLATQVAADFGWTLLEAHGVVNVMAGPLPLGAGATIAEAVKTVLDEHAPHVLSTWGQ
jgi:hypothetical protein